MSQRKKRPPVDAFISRAVQMAKRDGIPAIGSQEIRLHGPLDSDRYITSDKVMVSFRTARGLPVALLERLYADDENTCITDRDAVVVDPLTGFVHDAGLLFQSEPGSYTSVMAGLEISLDKKRKNINREKKGMRNKMNGHVLARIHHQADLTRDLICKFKQAADVLGVSASPEGLESTRRLFNVHPSTQIAG